MRGYDEIITFRPIGFVENSFAAPVSPETLRDVESRVVLDPALIEGLTGVESGQSLMVIFHFHLSSTYELLQHPRGDLSRPRRGVFALRSPHRPNGIGVAIVEVLAVEGNVLRVRGLDALDGTPVLDLKSASMGSLTPDV
jgi:tRNA-Thr(GGU) m(6)t(6)A37 methyltransferase TsaA